MRTIWALPPCAPLAAPLRSVSSLINSGNSVDNLGGGSDHPHIDVSNVMLCYLTRKWFINAPCLREFVRAILRKTQMIALLEPFTDAQHGGHTEAEARGIIASQEWWDRWYGGMQSSVNLWAEEWGQPDLKLPSAQEAIDALFKSAPVVWSRLAAFRQPLADRKSAPQPHTHSTPL